MLEVKEYGHFADKIVTLATDRENNIYYGTDKNRIVKMDSDGNMIWNIQFTDTTKPIIKIATDSNNNVYTISYDYTLKGFNKNGNMIWSHKNMADTYYIDLLIDESDFIYASSYGTNSVQTMIEVYTSDKSLQNVIYPLLVGRIVSVIKDSRNIFYIFGSNYTEKTKENYTEMPKGTAIIERRI